MLRNRSAGCAFRRGSCESVGDTGRIERAEFGAPDGDRFARRIGEPASVCERERERERLPDFRCVAISRGERLGRPVGIGRPERRSFRESVGRSESERRTIERTDRDVRKPAAGRRGTSTFLCGNE